MFEDYLENPDQQPGYHKAFVSLWQGWLGEENLHQLETVTEAEWGRFHDWLRDLAKQYELVQVDTQTRRVRPLKSLEDVLDDYPTSMNQESTQFLAIGIPALECVIREDWDATYIIWHKNNGALTALKPSIEQAGLKCFVE